MLAPTSKTTAPGPIPIAVPQVGPPAKISRYRNSVSPRLRSATTRPFGSSASSRPASSPATARRSRRRSGAARSGEGTANATRRGSPPAPGAAPRTAHSATPGGRASVGLDLPELDAEAADLHLEVEPAQVLDLAARQPSRQVARPVAAAPRATPNGSGTKRSAVSSGRPT